MNLPSQQTDSPTPRSVPVDLADVIQAEHEAIAERRRVLDLPSEDGSFKPQNDLVGLALSGGGLRSAMFNLGFLKALHDSGFMKFVDYLSTVSGGGYIGAYFSTLGNEYRIAAEEQAKGQESVAADSVSTQFDQSTGMAAAQTRPDIAMDDAELSRKLEEATYRFINGGQYLKQPWIFFTQWIYPTLKILALYVSLLVTVATVIALMFRATDFPVVQDYYRLLGPQSEAAILFLNICLLWCVLLVIYGLVLLIVMKPRPEEAPVTQPGSLLSDSTIRYVRNLRSQIYESGMWLQLMVVSILCGVAIAIGNYDFGLFSGASIKFQSEARFPLIIMAIAGLASILKLPSLLKSEKATASVWQKSVMWVVLSCAVGGGSLAVLTIVGKEGISGFPVRRGASLHSEDSLNDRLLATTVMNEIALFDFIKNEPEEQDILKGRAMRLLELTEKLDDSNAELFPGDARWITQWYGVALHKYPRDWFKRMYWWATGNDKVRNYLQLSADARESRGLLLSQINDLFFQAPKSSSLNVDDELASTSSKITQDLLAAFQQRVLEDRLKQTKGSTVDYHSQLEVGKNIESYLNGIVINESPFLGADGVKFTVLKCLGNDGNLKYLPDTFEYHDELFFRRQLLEATYPQVFKQLAFISSPVVVRYDQEMRFWILGLSFLLSVLLCFTLDFNHKAAFFKFYKDRIAKTFIEAGHLNPMAPAGGTIKDIEDKPLPNSPPGRSGFLIR